MVTKWNSRHACAFCTTTQVVSLLPFVHMAHLRTLQVSTTSNMPIQLFSRPQDRFAQGWWHIGIAQIHITKGSFCTYNTQQVNVGMR